MESRPQNISRFESTNKHSKAWKIAERLRKFFGFPQSILTQLCPIFTQKTESESHCVRRNKRIKFSFHSASERRTKATAGAKTFPARPLFVLI